MSQSPAHWLFLRLEDWRLRQHFKRVEGILRERDVTHLPSAQQQARATCLDQLRTYAARGRFPRNEVHPGAIPCFIDYERRECAVAYLMLQSGNTALAYKIQAAANYAYLPQMTFPELHDWAAETGLSLEELALIQPGYYDTLDGATLHIVLVIWAAGMVMFMLNAVYTLKKRAGVVLPVIAGVFAVVLLLLSVFCVLTMLDAHAVGTHVDVAPSHARQALDAVAPWASGAIVSLLIALLTGGISIYRIWQFRRTNTIEHS